MLTVSNMITASAERFNNPNRLSGLNLLLNTITQQYGTQ